MLLIIGKIRTGSRYFSYGIYRSKIYQQGTKNNGAFNLQAVYFFGYPGLYLFYALFYFEKKQLRPIYINNYSFNGRGSSFQFFENQGIPFANIPEKSYCFFTLNKKIYLEQKDNASKSTKNGKDGTESRNPTT